MGVRCWDGQPLLPVVASTQLHIAKIEAGDPNVSTDRLIRALFATGAARKEAGAIISAGCDWPNAPGSVTLHFSQQGQNRLPRPSHSCGWGSRSYHESEH